MAAVAAANPIPTGDLRLILLIAFLPTLHNKPLQKRRAHFVMNGGPKKEAVSGESACRWHNNCRFALSGIRHSPLAAQRRGYTRQRQRTKGFGFNCANVRFGSKADICSAPTHVRFIPNSDRKSRHAQMVMSALPLKADMCGATRDVRFGPIAAVILPASVISPGTRSDSRCKPQR